MWSFLNGLHILRSRVIFSHRGDLVKAKNLRGPLLLLITAAIWGSTFVAQNDAMNSIGPCTFNAIRTFLGGLVLLPVLWIMKKRRPQESFGDKKTLYIGGICCGAALAIASVVQSWGIASAEVGKAGFISALYIVIVPLIAAVFLKKKLPLIIIPCILLAVVGLYLLCMSGSFGLSFGELLVLISTLFFSIHILVIGAFSPKVNGIALSCIQFFSAAIISAILALIFEVDAFSFASLKAAAFPIIYAGVFAIGVADTFQIIAQKDTDPTIASLIMSLESVFAVLSGWIFLHETLTLRELLGCLLVFIAVILSELPIKKKE